MSAAPAESQPGEPSGAPVRATVCAAIALLLVAVSFLLESRRGVDLADEGFLWYGTWRTALGEIPVRDFSAYDPGRYVWGAAWSHLFGTGILALRLSNALFQWIGLTLGLLALRSTLRRAGLLALAGGLLALWMFPRHKLFESSIAMATVFIAVWLQQRPSLRRHFGAGVFLGTAALFGGNLGLYGFLGLLAVIVRAARSAPGAALPARLGCWAAGIAAGYSPMLALLGSSPGFRIRFFDVLASHFRRGATNLSLPVPWPWTIQTAGMPPAVAASAVATSLLYLLAPLLFIALIAFFARSRGRGASAVLVGAVCVGAPYLHHAFSRAALAHLAQAIAPFLMAAIALPALHSGRTARTAASVFLVLVAALSVLSVGIVRWQLVKSARVPVSILGDRVQVTVETVDLLEDLAGVARDCLSPGERVVVFPRWPGIYVLLQRASPAWDLYAIFPETPARETAVIENLNRQRVNWAILENTALDNREDRRFGSTHPVLWRFFETQFAPVRTLRGGISLRHRRQQQDQEGRQGEPAR